MRICYVIVWDQWKTSGCWHSIRCFMLNPCHRSLYKLTVGRFFRFLTIQGTQPDIPLRHINVIPITKSCLIIQARISNLEKASCKLEQRRQKRKCIRPFWLKYYWYGQCDKQYKLNGCHFSGVGIHLWAQLFLVRFYFGEQLLFIGFNGGAQLLDGFLLFFLLFLKASFQPEGSLLEIILKCFKRISLSLEQPILCFINKQYIVHIHTWCATQSWVLIGVKRRASNLEKTKKKLGESKKLYHIYIDMLP